MSLSRGGNIADAVKLSPFVHSWVVAPYVIKPLEAVRATKSVSRKLVHTAILRSGGNEVYIQVHLVIVRDHGMIRTGGWCLWRGIGLKEDLPPVGR